MVRILPANEATENSDNFVHIRVVGEIAVGATSCAVVVVWLDEFHGQGAVSPYRRCPREILPVSVAVLKVPAKKSQLLKILDHLALTIMLIVDFAIERC